MVTDVRLKVLDTPSSTVGSTIPLIKAVRAITGCGLKEAKDIVDGILNCVEVGREETCNLGEKHTQYTRLHDVHLPNRFIEVLEADVRCQHPGVFRGDKCDDCGALAQW